MMTALDNETFELVIEYINWVKLGTSNNDDVRAASYNNVLDLEAKLLQAGMREEQISQIAKAVR